MENHRSPRLLKWLLDAADISQEDVEDVLYAWGNEDEGGFVVQLYGNGFVMLLTRLLEGDEDGVIAFEEIPELPVADADEDCVELREALKRGLEE